MDDFHVSETRVRGRPRRTARAAVAAAEADLPMRLLIAALVLVLAGVVAASTLVQLGEFRSAEVDNQAACVRLAGDDPGRCATRTEVADRLMLSRLAR
jgi:hypothetical protein